MRPNALRYFLLALLLLQAILLFRVPPRSDERRFYSPVYERSAEVWPRLNTTHLHYGVSPLYAWANGLGVRVLGDLCLPGRLLSLLCFGLMVCDALFVCRNVALLLILANPVTLRFAILAHPFLPSLLFLWIGLRLRERSVVLSCLALGAAANLQLYMAALALLWGCGRPGGDRVRLTAWALVAGFLGVVLNWVLMGGMYTEQFYGSAIYFREFVANASRRGWGHALLMLAFAGYYLYLLHPPRQDRLRKVPAAAAWAAFLAGAALLAFAGKPEGPLVSACSALGPWAGPAIWALLLTVLFAGWWRLGTADRTRMWLSAIPLAAVLYQLPFNFERVAWFGVTPLLVAWILLGFLPGRSPRSERPENPGHEATATSEVARSLGERRPLVVCAWHSALFLALIGYGSV